MTLRLHNFFRSSTSTRLRAAMNLKGIAYDYVTEEPGRLALNPAGLVPALELDDGQVLTQSLAIMEWLDETYPEPPLLPRDAIGRARVRSLAYMIAMEIHPINNRRVQDYLTEHFGADRDARDDWFRHWVATTFAPMELVLATSPDTGSYCHGELPGLADCCLYAQVINNRRFGVDMSPYPTINRIFAALDTLEPFRAAAPANQPDAV